MDQERPPRRDAGRPRGAPIRDQVLACTLAELAEHGLDGLRVERIAEAAAVNKTTVYRRWPTRQALVAAALERVAEDLSAKIVDTGSLPTDLLGVAQEVGAFLERPEGAALARAVTGGRANPELADLARRQAAKGALGAAGALYARAVARGEWRLDAPPEVVFGALVGGVLHRVLLEGQPADPAWASSLVDLLVRGVRP